MTTVMGAALIVVGSFVNAASGIVAACRNVDGTGTLRAGGVDLTLILSGFVLLASGA